MARFGVWNGVRIDPAYQSLTDIRNAVRALRPRGYSRWALEWLVKAGEGGTWQGAWDPHRLATHGPGDLEALVAEGRRLRPRLYITPYVVVRGRSEWWPEEVAQIVNCALANNGRVVLNLEPGEHYWNGPTAPDELAENYLRPIWHRIQMQGTTPRLELCSIPRSWTIASLGGAPTINEWLAYCVSASWECYDAVAPDLDVAASMARLEQLGIWGDELNERPAKWRRIPVVQRSRIEAWAGTEYARRGLQVWHLDGD